MVLQRVTRLASRRTPPPRRARGAPVTGSAARRGPRRGGYTRPRARALSRCSQPRGERTPLRRRARESAVLSSPIQSYVVPRRTRSSFVARWRRASAP